MLLKLKRTQKTAIGRLEMGVVYDFDEKNQAQAEVAKSLIGRKMADQVSDKEHAKALAAVKKVSKGGSAEKEAADKAAAEKEAADKAAAEKEAADKAAAEAKAAGK